MASEISELLAALTHRAAKQLPSNSDSREGALSMEGERPHSRGTPGLCGGQPSWLLWGPPNNALDPADEHQTMQQAYPDNPQPLPVQHASSPSRALLTALGDLSGGAAGQGSQQQQKQPPGYEGNDPWDGSSFPGAAPPPPNGARATAGRAAIRSASTGRLQALLERVQQTQQSSECRVQSGGLVAVSDGEPPISAGQQQRGMRKVECMAGQAVPPAQAPQPPARVPWHVHAAAAGRLDPQEQHPISLPPDVVVKLQRLASAQGGQEDERGPRGEGGAPFQHQAGHGGDTSETALLLETVLRKRAQRVNAPLEVPVICNGKRGTFNVDTQLMTCACSECQEQAQRGGAPPAQQTPTEFERHCGMGASKKWKYTVRVLVPHGTVTLGAWLEGHGIQSRYTRSSKPPASEDAGKGGTATSAPPLSAARREQRRRRKRGSSDDSGAESEDLGGGGGDPEAHSVQPPSCMDGLPGSFPTAPLMGPPSRDPRRDAGGGLSPERREGQPGVGDGFMRCREAGRGEPTRCSARAAPKAEEESQWAGPDGVWGGLPPRSPFSAAHQQELDQEQHVQQDGQVLGEVEAIQQVLSGGGLPPGALPALRLRQRAASLDQPALMSPSGKMWMSRDMHLDTVGGTQDTRLGERYQAKVPPASPRPPSGVEAERGDPLAAEPGPLEAEALESAAGREKLGADLMPRDAVVDLWLLEAEAMSRGQPLLERNQRQRRKPQWMEHTVDPTEVLGGRAPGGGGAWNAALAEREGGGTPGGKRPAGPDTITGRGGKRPRSASDQPPALLEAELALSQGHRLELGDWQLLEGGQLALSVHLGGVMWQGTLAPAPAPESARGAGALGGGALSAQPSGMGSWGGGTEKGGWGVAVSPTFQEDTPASLRAKEGDGERSQQAERRAAADAEFARLEQQGPPEGTKCGLCRQAGTDVIPPLSIGPGGRSQKGLGDFILVRVSAVSLSWVHRQCACWSPEVAENSLGSGRMDTLKDCVRRGRMIRCRVCGEKGATLGCHKPTCRSSYHLHCARKNNCLLQVEPYRVACPNHADEVPGIAQRTLSQHEELLRAKEAAAAGAGGGAGRDDPLRKLAELSAQQPEAQALADETPASQGAPGAALQQTPGEGEGGAGGYLPPSALGDELLQFLGGTVGTSKWRPGRCSVCVVQRKGRCGTDSAPKKCRRRLAIARNPELAKLLLPPDVASPTSGSATPASPLEGGGNTPPDRPSLAPAENGPLDRGGHAGGGGVAHDNIDYWEEQAGQLPPGTHPGRGLGAPSTQPHYNADDGGPPSPTHSFPPNHPPGGGLSSWMRSMVRGVLGSDQKPGGGGGARGGSEGVEGGEGQQGGAADASADVGQPQVALQQVQQGGQDQGEALTNVGEQLLDRLGQVQIPKRPRS